MPTTRQQYRNNTVQKMDNSKRLLSKCGLPWCAHNEEASQLGNQQGWICTGDLFECITHAYGKGCFNHPFYPLYVIDTLCERAKIVPDLKDALEQMVVQGLDYVKKSTLTKNGELYEAAEVLFIMASVCFQCDEDRIVCRSISNIIRAQMELVTAVTQAGAPWTRQLSISRWFAFLSTSSDDRQRLHHLYPEYKQEFETLSSSATYYDVHREALSYYLYGAKDVIFKLPFKRNPSSLGVPDSAEPWQTDPQLDVPEGFLLHNIQLYDFPIRKASLDATFTPLGLACTAGAPTIVSLLLQHGATPILYLESMTETPLGRLVEPVGILMRLLNRSQSWRNWNTAEVEDSVLRDLQHTEVVLERNLLRCFAVMMRVIASVPIHLYKESDKDSADKSNGYKVGEDGKPAFYLHERYRNVVQSNRINTPPELQHLCRLRIRKCLAKLRRLPDGVDQLPLTCVLLPYMKLLT